MIRKVLSTLAAMALVVAGWAAPAQAALSDCTAYSGVVCLWKDGNAGGIIWRQTLAQVPSTSCRALTGGWSNTVTTVRLQTTGQWVLQAYDNASCTGAVVEIYQNAALEFTYDFTGNPWNNKISSVKLRVK